MTTTEVDLRAGAPAWRRSWLSEFDFVPGGLLVRRSGVFIPVNDNVIRNVLRFFVFFVRVHASLVLAPPPAPRFSVCFTPFRPRPWFLLWPVVKLAGGEIVADPGRADLVMHYHDTTETDPKLPDLRPGATAWNFGLRSIAKSRVGEAFERAFGYGLTVDPETWSGLAVEKSEANATHDGRIVSCPTQAVLGKVYQRLVDNVTPKGLVQDLRTTVVSGVPKLVFVKERPEAKRFENTNVRVEMALPGDVFSADEIACITAFAGELGVDWAGIDILRDRASGRLYIVDANPTDMGPPVAMAVEGKLASARVLARALREVVLGADGGEEE